MILSGQLGLVPGETPARLIEGGAPAELRQALENATVLLNSEGAQLSDVVKATVFLPDLTDFAACNEVWLEFFEDPRPTRSTIGVAALPLGAHAEVELWAYAPQV